MWKLWSWRSWNSSFRLYYPPGWQIFLFVVTPQWQILSIWKRDRNSSILCIGLAQMNTSVIMNHKHKKLRPQGFDRMAYMVCSTARTKWLKSSKYLFISWWKLENKVEIQYSSIAKKSLKISTAQNHAQKKNLEMPEISFISRMSLCEFCLPWYWCNDFKICPRDSFTHDENPWEVNFPAADKILATVLSGQCVQIGRWMESNTSFLYPLFSNVFRTETYSTCVLHS